jgi:hypothetical protein
MWALFFATFPLVSLLFHLTYSLFISLLIFFKYFKFHVNELCVQLYVCLQSTKSLLCTFFIQEHDCLHIRTRIVFEL